MNARLGAPGPVRLLAWGAALLVATAFSGCGSNSGGGTGAAKGATYTVTPGADAQSSAIIDFFNAHEGDTIHFTAGTYDLTTSLIMTGKSGITIEGDGIDKTILSFKGSALEDGLSFNHMTGITVRNMTIYDAPGNGLRFLNSDYVTVDTVKVGWSVADPASSNYNSNQSAWTADGSYAFYPVLCNHVLIENSISVGSADAGVYVGQSNDILVKNTEAFHNVAGFEFENTYSAEFTNNKAHDNVGGFLVFDLPGRAQNGEKNLVHDNESWDNNVKSFAARGAIVGDVPEGTGMMVIATDQLEVYNNNIHDNNTLGLAIVNYGLADASEASTKYDFYPEGIHVYDNTFTDNGGKPESPDLSRDTCTGPGGLPSPGEDPSCLEDNPSLLPLVLRFKNKGNSGDIVWDGATDTPNSCTTFPLDENGIPLDQPDPEDIGRYEARVDERGRPNFYLYDPNPVCKYNAWKFNETGQLNEPQNGICIQNNTFSSTQSATAKVDGFVNFHMANTDLSNPANLQAADHNVPQQCPTLVQPYLDKATPDLGSFVPNPADDPHPSDADTSAVCGAVQQGQINYKALASYNCPTLDQYGLFANPQEPRSGPNGFGVPYDLNTILFSDYAVKYRFLFLPPDANGQVQKAIYQDHDTCTTLSIYDCYTATLKFPVGTVLAKTFAFRDGSNEAAAETRLLIKRQDSKGNVFWTGLPYEWGTDGNGNKVATLTLQGDTKTESYDYDDPDPAVVDSNGNPVHYGPGTVQAYQIPNANACQLCHGGDDLESGAPPIGPKVRNLNKNFTYPDGSTQNQLSYLQSHGMLDLPDVPANLEFLPKWNVPGDDGDVPNSAADVHHRMRAYLEVNCMHCHNPAGNAQNSGLSLDSFGDPMDEGHGVCKSPTAAGQAAATGNYDIEPGDASESILVARLSSAQPGIRMPPVGRTVVQPEMVSLLTPWVNDDVIGFADPNATWCATTPSSARPQPQWQVPLPFKWQGKQRYAPWG